MMSGSAMRRCQRTPFFIMRGGVSRHDKRCFNSALRIDRRHYGIRDRVPWQLMKNVCLSGLSPVAW
jgi:hypothetical protein